MLVISNPPFGKMSSLARKCKQSIDETYPDVDSVYLTPQMFCRNNIEGLNKCSLLNIHFEGIDLVRDNLVITYYKPGCKQLTQPRIVKQLSRNRPLMFKLYKKIWAYNKDKQPFAKFIVSNIQDPIVRINTYKQVVEQYGFERLFFLSIRQTDDLKSHLSGADVDMNIKHRLNNSCFYVYLFNNSIERNNFVKWFYSKPLVHNSLVYYIGSLIKYYLLRTVPAVDLLNVIPRVDWTKPWTDEEIYKEIGLCK